MQPDSTAASASPASSRIHFFAVCFTAVPPFAYNCILYHTTGRGVLVVLFCVFLRKTQSTDRLSAVRTEMVGDVPRQRMRMMAFTVPPPTVPTMVA